MRVKVGFSRLEGSVKLPSSKSCVQRALVMALLSKGRSVLHGVSGCDDSQVVMGLASALGAEIKEDREKGLIEVYSEGQLRVSGTRLFCKESGFALRVFFFIVIFIVLSDGDFGRGFFVGSEDGTFIHYFFYMGGELSSSGSLCALTGSGSFGQGGIYGYVG